MSERLLEAVKDLQSTTLHKLQDMDERQLELAKKLQAIEQRSTSGDHGMDPGAESGSAGVIVKALQGSPEVRALIEGKTRNAGVPIDSSLLFGRKNTIVSADARVPAQRQPGIVIAPQRRVWVSDLLPVVPTTSGSIEYMRENVYTNNAAEVAEAALKPESSITFDLATSQVRTIAHWISLSEQTLDDAPALTQHVGARLVYGLKLRLENQVLTGNGTGANLAGILNAGNFTVHTPQAGDTALDTLRRARAELEAAGFEIDGFVLHPRDVSAIELLKDTTGGYIAGDPATGQPASLWGVPVVSTPAVAQGSFIAGAFDQAAILFLRQDATLQLGRSGDDFRRNLVTLRAEMRAGLAVQQTGAIRSGLLVTA